MIKNKYVAFSPEYYNSPHDNHENIALSDVVWPTTTLDKKASNLMGVSKYHIMPNGYGSVIFRLAPL